MPKYHLRLTCDLAKKHHFNCISKAVKKRENKMESLPSEVLEIIFHPLSKKEDIQKCYETNSKWKHIIENMFTGTSILDSITYFHD